MVEDVRDRGGRPQGRISDASRLDVAENVTSAAQEHDAVSRWIRFVPFQFVVRDLDLGPDVDMRTMPRLVRPIVSDLGVGLAVAHMDLIGPIGVGFTTARGGWDIRLHQRLILPFGLFMMVRIVGLGTAHDERRNNPEHESSECDFQRHHIFSFSRMFTSKRPGFL